MRRNRLLAAALNIALAATVLGIAGCAADPRYKQGVDWVQWNEMEKKRLQAAGFPQYNLD
jgi:uncharacterized lipoprotein